MTVTFVKLAMTGHYLEIISQIVLWYENSFRIDCLIYMLKRFRNSLFEFYWEIFRGA